MIIINHADCQPDEIASILKDSSSPYTKELLRKKPHYVKIIGNSKLTSDIDLSSFPPTSCAAREHSFRVYHTLQQWKGNILDPCKWGWMKDEFKPVFTSKPPIPEKLAETISCNCKSGCKRCGCRRVRNECSVLCTHYNECLLSELCKTH